MVDINVWFGTTPPVFVPESGRAKLFLDLPGGADGVIILGPTDQVMSAIPSHFVMGECSTEPKLVAISGIAVLH